MKALVRWIVLLEDFENQPCFLLILCKVLTVLHVEFNLSLITLRRIASGRFPEDSPPAIEGGDVGSEKTAEKTAEEGKVRGILRWNARSLT